MNEISWLEYSSGGVPASKIFEMVLDDLEVLIAKSEGTGAANTQREVCFIGLISYFEAFCKDLFASTINIVPSLLSNLKVAGYNISTDLTNVALYKNNVEHKLGFLVAENFDFGTAKTINNLYGALLVITPFSKEQIKTFDDMLRDRNLIVHHSGIYTLKYIEQSKIIDKKPDENAFFQSLMLSKDATLERLAFIKGIAKKMSNSVSKNLADYCSKEGVTLTDEQNKAIKYLCWDGE